MNNVRQLFDSGWYPVKYCALQSDPENDLIDLDTCVQQRSCHLLMDGTLAVFSTVCYPALAVIVALGEMALLLDLTLRSYRVKNIERRISELAAENDVTAALQARKEVLKRQIENYRKQLESFPIEVKIGSVTLSKERAVAAYYARNKNADKWSERSKAHNYMATLQACKKAEIEWSELNVLFNPNRQYKKVECARLRMSLVKSNIQRQINRHHIRSLALLLIPVVGSVLWIHSGQTLRDRLETSLIDRYNNQIGWNKWLTRY